MKKVAMAVALALMFCAGSLIADDDEHKHHKVGAEEMGAAGLAAATLLAGGVYLVRRRGK